MRVANVIPGAEVALYESADGGIRLDVQLEQETVWLTQAQMAELFGRERSVITKHISNVFAEGERSARRHPGQHRADFRRRATPDAADAHPPGSGNVG